MKQATSAPVGLIGLGAMGMGMATSLVRAGFQVQAFDINPSTVERFVTAGGEAAESAARAAAGAAALIVVVVNAAQMEDVLFAQGAAAALPHGSVVILCSTVKPDFAPQTAQRLYALGLEVIDAPISGGAAKAAEGRLSIMASGHPGAFEQAGAILHAMAEHLYQLGDECGIGSTVKTVNQLLAGVHIAAAAEAMALGVRAGADPQQLYDVISNSAGSSWMFQNRVPHMLAGDFTPLSAVNIFVKDLGIVLDAGKELEFPLPLAAAAHQLYLMAAAAGLGREDDSAVVKVFEHLSGLQVRAKS